MKNTGLYIIGGLTLALVGALAVYEYNNRKRYSTFAAPLITDGYDSPAMQRFKGFNFSIVLNSSTKRAVPEITCLQRMINAYYNGTASIDVTGVWDTQTKNAVKDITGKTSTSLFEFNTQYLVKERGAKVADDLIKSMTVTGQ